MTTASPEHQLQLLEVQRHESKVRHLRRLRAEAVADPRLAAAQALVDGASGDVEQALGAQAEADGAVEALETKAKQVAAHIKKDEAQLISGQAGAGTLQGLQREIEALTVTASELEDAEIEALDAAEEAAAVVVASQKGLETERAAQAAVRADVDATVAGIDGQIAEALGERAGASDGLPEDLMTVFESTLQRRGAGAARLFHGTSEGSGMALAPGDLADIKRAAVETVVFCPDSGVILVRSAEWA